MRASLPAGRQGFTIIELIVVFTIVAILGGLVSLNLLGVQRGASLTAVSEQILADLAHTRLRSMSGMEAQGSGNAHGIHLEADRYTIFIGATYNSSATTNAEFLLPPNIQITSITFPNGDIVFTQGNGEISPFTDGANTFAIREINSNESRSVELNAMGTVVSNDYE